MKTPISIGTIFVSHRPLKQLQCPKKASFKLDLILLHNGGQDSMERGL